MKDDFLTIPDAQIYEINSEFVVRNKKTGRIMSVKKRVCKDSCIAALWYNGKEVKRDVKTFRRQAEIAVEDANLKMRDQWHPIKSLNNLYEINRKGVVRNAKTKRVKKLIQNYNFCGYVFWNNGEQVSRALKRLLNEVFGKGFKTPHWVKISTTISKDGKRLKFDSLSATMRFLSEVENKNFETVRYFIRKRSNEIYGWKIIFHRPANPYRRKKLTTTLKPKIVSHLDEVVRLADECGLSYGKYKLMTTVFGKTFEELKADFDRRRLDYE